MTERPKDSLSDTSVGRIADEVTAKLRAARKTPVQRATASVARAAVQAADATAKLTPLQWFFLIVGLGVMVGGFIRLEQHKHAPEGGYVHLGSDWLIVMVGIAFMPTAGDRVGKGFKAVGSGLAALVTAVRGKGGNDAAP